MSLILMTTLFYKALLLQGEIWCWSILGFKRVKHLLHFVPRPSFDSPFVPDQQTDPAFYEREGDWEQNTWMTLKDMAFYLVT